MNWQALIASGERYIFCVQVSNDPQKAYLKGYPISENQSRVEIKSTEDYLLTVKKNSIISTHLDLDGIDWYNKIIQQESALITLKNGNIIAGRVTGYEDVSHTIQISDAFSKRTTCGLEFPSSPVSLNILISDIISLMTI